MVSFDFSYEYFIERSAKLNRSEYKLPTDSYEQFLNIKKKLNIHGELDRIPILKPTTFVKQDEIIGNLFKQFNKITGKTYEKLSADIFSIVSQNSLDAGKICDTFFKVILNNSFFCHLYAKLYKGFISITSDFEDALEIQISKYVENITNIVYVSANEDYDKYCDYVKETENIKNFTSFLIQCLKQQIIHSDILFDLALLFQNHSLNNIDDEEKIVLNDIYISNIAIIVRDAYKELYIKDKWKIFMTNFELLMKSDGCGKNKKMHFKLLDISDNISKYTKKFKGTNT